MNIGKRKTRRDTKGDPAHAFGSQEQLMEEFRRQNYVESAKAPRPSLLGSLRERAVSVIPHRSDAPVYSAETFASETAPDLGWEAAFSPEKKAPQEAEPAAAAQSAEARYEAFRRTVYSSPVPRRYGPFNDYSRGGGYTYGSKAAPVYEEISFNAPLRHQNDYQKPVYEELSFASPERNPAPAAPIYEDLMPHQPEGPFEAGEGNSPTEQFGDPSFSPAGRRDTAHSGSDYLPPVASGDWRYVFWSASILVGAALTVFSFIYACTL